MNKFFNRIPYLILLLLLSLLIYNRWIFDLGILRSGDWGFFYKETLTSFNIYWFTMWLGDAFGRVPFDVGQAPTYAFYGFLAKYFSANYAIAERIVHMWPIALFTSVFAYLLLRLLSFKPIASFIGALVYAYNTYFLIIQTGHVTLMGAFAFAPLVLLFYIKTLQTLKIDYALITGLLLAISFAYEPRAVYIVVWVLLFYAGYSFLFSKDIVSKKNLLRSIAISFIPMIVLGLLNLYWIGAFLQTHGTGVGEIVGRRLFGNEFYHISYSFTLFHPFWTGQEQAVFNPQQIFYYFWFIPLAAFFGLFLNRRNAFVVFFGFITLLGIILSKQVGPPLTEVYPWLYDHFPGFSAFREASKFYFLVALGYSVLIGSLIDWLWEYWIQMRLKSYGKYIITIGIAVIFLWNTKPLITGDIGTLFVSRNVPKEYELLKDFFIKQPNYFRTFWVPQGTHFGFVSDVHPVADWSPFLEVMRTQDKNKDENNLQLKPGETLIRRLNKPYANALLDKSSIKYLIVPIRDSVNDDDRFIYLEKKRDYYINELDKLSYLSRVDIGLKELVVYENKDFRPHFYVTKEKESLNKYVSFGKILYSYISFAEYKVHLVNISQPVYLHFVENYHPDWKLHVGEFHWFNILLKSNYFLPDDDHTRNVVGFNSYFIDPQKTCHSAVCVKNKDGSYNIDLTVYFRPQSYLYLGEIISGSLLVLILGFLFANFLKKYEKK